MRHQDNSDLQIWLREAKVLHKQATSKSLAHSLPVLRRLLSTQVLTNISLKQLKSNTDIIQRKHLLHMLAVENGEICWADFEHKVSASPQGSMLPYSVELKNAGYPVLWFSSLEEAQDYSEQHSGKVIQVNNQAVVVPDSK